MGNTINYKVFFDALSKGIHFWTERGEISLYDLFRLPMDELINIYKELKQKAIVDNDPILGQIGADKDERLRFEVVKSVIVYRQEQAKKNELKKKKEQLKKMLDEIRMKQLEQNPEKIIEELEKINQELEEI